MVESDLPLGKEVNGLPLIVAHRGSSRRAPENTWPAFELAVKAGADGIEMDVLLAADGVPVVFHDDRLERFTGEQTGVRGLSSRELSSVPVGAWFNRTNAKFADPAFEDVSVPTLESVVRGLEGYGGVVYVELKCGEEDGEKCAEAVAEVLSASGMVPNFVVKSFRLDTIPVIRKANPALRTAALFEPKSLSDFRNKGRMVDMAMGLGADALSLHYSLATKKLVSKAAESGLGVAVWTVDKPAWVKRAMDRGIGAIITNRPEEMLERRNEIRRRVPATA